MKTPVTQQVFLDVEDIYVWQPVRAHLVCSLLCLACGQRTFMSTASHLYFSLSLVNSYIGFVIYLVISVFGVRIKTIITELRLFDMYHLLKYLSNFCAECSTVLIKAVVLVSWSNKNRRLSKPILSLVIF